MLQDILQSVRQLRLNPGFSVIAICVIALGIGANTAIFSVIDAVILKPLPYADPDRLVMLWETRPDVSIFVGRRGSHPGRRPREIWSVFGSTGELLPCFRTWTPGPAVGVGSRGARRHGGGQLLAAARGRTASASAGKPSRPWG